LKKTRRGGNQNGTKTAARTLIKLVSDWSALGCKYARKCLSNIK
jgi:hypothetical protein